MNLNSKNFNKGDSITIGLNWSYLGIYGQTLFNGINSTSEKLGICFMMISFHKLVSRSNLFVFLSQESMKPSCPIALPYLNIYLIRNTSY